MIYRGTGTAWCPVGQSDGHSPIKCGCSPAEVMVAVESGGPVVHLVHLWTHPVVVCQRLQYYSLSLKHLHEGLLKLYCKSCRETHHTLNRPPVEALQGSLMKIDKVTAHGWGQ